MTISEKRRVDLFAALESSNVPMDGFEPPVVSGEGDAAADAAAAAAGESVNPASEPPLADDPAQVATTTIDESQPAEAGGVEEQPGTTSEEATATSGELVNPDSPEDTVIVQQDVLTEEEQIEVEAALESEDAPQFDRDVLGSNTQPWSLESSYVDPAKAVNRVRAAQEVLGRLNALNPGVGTVDLYGKRLMIYARREGSIVSDLIGELKNEVGVLNNATAIVKEFTNAVPKVAGQDLESADKAAEAVTQIVERAKALRFLASFQLKENNKVGSTVTSDANGKEAGVQGKGTAAGRVGRFAGLYTLGNISMFAGMFLGPVGFVVGGLSAIYLNVKAWGQFFKTNKEKEQYKKLAIVRADELKKALQSTVAASIALITAAKAFAEQTEAVYKGANGDQRRALKTMRTVVASLVEAANANLSFADGCIKPLKKENSDSSSEGVSNESGADLQQEDGAATKDPVMPSDFLQGGEGVKKTESDTTAAGEAAKLGEGGETDTGERENAESKKIEAEANKNVIDEVVEVELTPEQVEKVLAAEGESLESEFAALGLMQQDLALVEAQADSLRYAAKHGGARSAMMSGVMATMGVVAERNGMDFSINGVGLESFDNYSERMLATDTSLESVVDFAKGLSKKIKDRARAVADKFRAINARIKLVNGKLEKQIDASIARVSGLDAVVPASVKHSAISNATAGAPTIENINRLATEIGKYTTGLNDFIVKGGIGLVKLAGSMTEDSEATARQALKLMEPPSTIARRTSNGFESRAELPYGFGFTSTVPANPTDATGVLKYANGIKIKLNRGESFNASVQSLSKEDALAALRAAKKLVGVVNQAIDDFGSNEEIWVEESGSNGSEDKSVVKAAEKIDTASLSFFWYGYGYASGVRTAAMYATAINSFAGLTK